MTWPLILLIVIGAVGFGLMLVAFVLVSVQGGWQKAIQQPIAERRWPLPRRLLLAGASLGMLFGIGVVVLRFIPGGIPWLESSSNNAAAPPTSPDVLQAAPHEVRSQPSDTSSLREQPAPDFDPKLTLDWPGTPQETRRRINAGLPDETTIYSASLAKTSPVTIFHAAVHEFSENDLQGSDANELLAGHGSTDDEVELSRQAIQLGSMKFPGCDLTAKTDASFLRRVNVRVGRRIYSVQVTSLKQERLVYEDVVKFFASFAVNE